LNDSLVLDVEGNNWILPNMSGSPPLPRYGHSAILTGSRIL